jgi:DNA repair exonuclease SbcCD nuclease subunit
MRFLHTADIHLGHQQYGSKTRFNDFSRVFLHIIDQAVLRQVDFVLLAGDLFEKRTVDPLAMRVAVEGLRKLRDANISALAVEGNHEPAYYRDQYSWLDFLDALGYLRLLNPRFEDGRAVLEAYGDAGRAYVDLPLQQTLRQHPVAEQSGEGKPDGARVYGVQYYGASTRKVFGLFADALAEIDHSNVEFAILMAHAGLEGQTSRDSGALTTNDLARLREPIDYLALGHVHKPYALDGWIYNPGAPETWRIEEVQWPERGYYVVDVEPDGKPGHQAELVVPPRRPFHCLRLEVDALTEPEAVYDAVGRLIRQEGKKIVRDLAPVVDLTLYGVLPFNRFDLDLDYVKGQLESAWHPVVARVRNMTTPAEFEIAVDMEASRPELERTILRELLERDARLRPDAEAWTQVALDVKRLALSGAPPEALVDRLRHAHAELTARTGEEV